MDGASEWVDAFLCLQWKITAILAPIMNVPNTVIKIKGKDNCCQYVVVVLLQSHNLPGSSLVTCVEVTPTVLKLV